VIASTGDLALQIVLVAALVLSFVALGVLGWIFLRAARRDGDGG
jgi:hypothetical protein